MDNREAALQREIDLKRAELIVRAEALRRSAVDTFDPRVKVRHRPLTGILVSTAAGLVLGLLPGRRRTENGKGPANNPLFAVAEGLLPGMLPALVGPLLSLIGSLRSRHSKT